MGKHRLPRTRVPLEQRFRAKVQFPDNTDGCWLWTASTDTGGYGQIGVWVGDKMTLELASHVAYRLYIGPLERGEWVLHTCDMPLCVSPWHLYKGDAAQNAHDRESRGRGRDSRGKLCGHAALAVEDVMAIRIRAGRGDLRRVIAADLGVSRSCVDKVVRRETWAHIP